MLCLILLQPFHISSFSRLKTLPLIRAILYLWSPLISFTVAFQVLCTFLRWDNQKRTCCICNTSGIYWTGRRCSGFLSSLLLIAPNCLTTGHLLTLCWHFCMHQINLFFWRYILKVRVYCDVGTDKFCLMIFFHVLLYSSLYLLAQNLIHQFLCHHQKTIPQCFAIFMSAFNIISAVNFVVLVLKFFCLWSDVVSIDYAVLTLLIMCLFWTLTFIDFSYFVIF